MDDASELPYVDLEGDGFERLLQELEGYILDEAGKSFLAQDELRWTVIEAIQRYEGNRFAAFDASLRSLHELAAPLCHVIELLKHVPNQPQIFFALGCNKTMTLERAVERYEALLGDLDKIAAAIPPPPKRTRGRPPRKDLRALVERLADSWVRATGRPFVQYWHKGVPIARATQFVYAVVSFMAPASLRALPKMTELIVKARRSVAPLK